MPEPIAYLHTMGDQVLQSYLTYSGSGQAGDTFKN